MTQISAPWGGISTGDASLAPYDDQEWARIWREMFRASKSDSGPIYGTGTSPDPGLTVQATGPASASVDVTAGSALVNGTWYNTDATVNLAIGANASGNPRIDTVVLRKDFAAQTIRLAVLPGTPAGSPVAAALTQTAATWEIPLADIAVANGFATITNANITPRRHFANAADGVYLFDILNNSGALLQTGDIVVWDLTADRAVKTSTTAGDPFVAGVWVGRTAAGGYGRVLALGIGHVYVNAAVTARGLPLGQSGTAKQAALSTGGPAIASSIQTTSGAGLCLAYVDVAAYSRPLVVKSVIAPGGADRASTSATFADVEAATFKITIVPRTTRVRVTMSFPGGANAGTHYGEYDIIRVGGSRLGHATHGLGSISAYAGGGTYTEHPITITGIDTGLTPGTSYEYRLQFRTTTAGQSINVSTNNNEATIMIAEEL